MNMWDFTPSENSSQQSTLQNFSLVVFPFFSLTTPFIVFLDYYNYGLFHLEIFIGIMGFIVLSLLCSAVMKYGGFIGDKIFGFALITFFLSIQFGSSGEALFALMLVAVAVLLLLLKENFNVLAAAIFAMFFVTSIFQALSTENVPSLEFNGLQAVAAEGPSMPRIIHIILDEHIGIEGLPTDLSEGVQVKKQLREFYENYGFMTFGGAYSHYFHTVNSVANLLNFSAASQDRMYIKAGESPNTLVHNLYFENLSSAGYRLNVWWGHHIDYCSNSPVVIDNCVQVPAGGLRLSQYVSLHVFDRVSLIFSGYLNLSKIYQKMRNYYQTFRNQLAPYKIPFPSSTWDRHKVTTLPYLFSFDDLWRNILSLPEGNAVLAHLLIPHYPYLTNSNCTIKTSINEWKYSSLLFTPNHPYLEGVHNTNASRIAHYQEYLKQLQCVYVKLEELFEKMKTTGMFENSIIIIHGDHGSRIVEREPTIEKKEKLSKQDIVAAYSTLFAVKLPGRSGAYDPNPYPIEYLLQEKIVNHLLEGKAAVAVPVPFVFLKSEDRTIKNLKPISYPAK